MQNEYSVETTLSLQERFEACKLHRPMRVQRYDAGTELVYDISGVDPDTVGKTTTARMQVERFVGGGFAGQVYRVTITDLGMESFGTLKKGMVCALKILVPPSGFSVFFRNVLYAVGFQGPFQLQTNPDAAIAGALWQKCIRRAAAVRFGDPDAVNDVHALLVDSALGSCGELSSWVDGRTWRLEVDNRMDALSRWKRGAPVAEPLLGSPEFRAKKKFMHRFVQLLNEMGAYEFARQYEWTTCKSQPNCLKRRTTDTDPATGLVAVDFRAGLTLLPFLPMSPGDILLILKGLLRGSLVQFDRGDTRRLEHFIREDLQTFADLLPLLEPLKHAEQTYRNSVPDITHNHVRLLYSTKLWGTIMASTVTGWKLGGRVDNDHEPRLRRSPLLVLLLMAAGLVPLAGKVLQKMACSAQWRRHYLSLLNPAYLLRALKGGVAERAIGLHRSGRISAATALRCTESAPLALVHTVLSVLPLGIHRLLTDWGFMRQTLHGLLVRPIRLYFDAPLREQWLRDMVDQGRHKNILTDADAEIILSKIKEPYIQKYLKSLAVHVCTVPVTQVVSVTLAALFWFMHPDMPPAERSLATAAILAAFQVVPLSPGSLTRGFYVVYLVIKERNFKDYNIALFLSFFKYVGYLAFPIQMAYRYPELARFMAGHWATDAVHVVPVFGERGALLEHWVFCLFYNWPLTIGRRIAARTKRRTALHPRRWHWVPAVLGAAAVFAGAEYLFASQGYARPTLKTLWYLVIGVPLALGAIFTAGAAGLILWRRIVGSAAAGAVAGILYGLVWDSYACGWNIVLPDTLSHAVWCVFLFTIFATIGALVTEIALPDPELSGKRV